MNEFVDLESKTVNSLPISQPSANPQPELPPTKRSFPLLGLILTILFLSITATAIYFGYQTFQLRTQLPVIESVKPAGSPMVQEVSQNISLVFNKGGDLWQKDSNGELIQVINANGRVINYSQAIGSSLVAYIHGEEVTNQVGQTYVEPSVVTVVNIATGQSKDIFTLKPYQPAGINTEFVEQLREVKFSADGQLLAITTGQSLLIYDTAAAKLKTVFNLPYTGGKTANGVFGYRGALFSPDKSKVILTAVHYESTGYIVVDLLTGKIYPTEYRSGYGGGNIIAGWVNNHQFLVTDSREEYTGSPEYPDLFITNFPSLTKEVVLQKSPGIDDLIMVTDQIGYVLFLQLSPTEPQGTVDHFLGKIDFREKSIFPVANLFSASAAPNPLYLLGTKDNQAYVLLRKYATQDNPYQESILRVDLTTGQVSNLTE